MTAVDDFRAAQVRLLQRYAPDTTSHFFEIPAVSGRVHALRRGQGPPLVLVPGFGDPAAMWAPLMGELDGVALHAVDRPSFGLTGRGDYETATFRRLAVDFLEQVLDVLGLDRPWLIGNSIGSLWCTWLALDRPDRVAGLIHIGCPAFILGTSAPLPLRLASVRPLGRVLMSLTPPSPRQVETFAKRVAGEDLSVVPEVRDLLVASQRLPGARDAILDLLHAVIRLRGARPQVALTVEQLARTRQPVLLIWGGRDPFGTPDVGREAARILPEADMRLIPNGGHLPWVRYPADVAAAAVPFLEKHGVPRGRRIT